MIHLGRFEFDLATALISESVDVIRILRDLVNMREHQPPHSLELFRTFVGLVKKTFSSASARGEDAGRGILWNLASIYHTNSALEILVNGLSLFFSEFEGILDTSLADKTCDSLLFVWEDRPPSHVVELLQILMQHQLSPDILEMAQRALGVEPQLPTLEKSENLAMNICDTPGSIRLPQCRNFPTTSSCSESTFQPRPKLVPQLHAKAPADVIETALRHLGRDRQFTSSLSDLLSLSSSHKCQLQELDEVHESLPALLASPKAFILAKLLQPPDKRLETFCGAFAALGSKRRELEIVACYVCGFDSLGEAVLASLPMVLTVLFLTRAQSAAEASQVEADSMESMVNIRALFPANGFAGI
jgi:hypothetical protein